MAGIDLTVSAGDGYVVVVMRGEIDLCTAADGVRPLAARAAPGTLIVVDLAELAFMDCCALRELMSVQKQARQAGGDLALAGPQPIVLRLIELSGLLGQSPAVFPSVHDAVSGARAVPLPPCAPEAPAAR